MKYDLSEKATDLVREKAKKFHISEEEVLELKKAKEMGVDHGQEKNQDKDSGDL